MSPHAWLIDGRAHSRSCVACRCLVAQFVRFDADQSGAIDKWELALLLIELGLLSGVTGPAQEAATRDWLARMDADGNGTIEWDELQVWWHAPGGGRAWSTAVRWIAKVTLT